MQFSSMDNMRRCIKRHVLADAALGSRTGLRILDVGGADVNGSYRPLFGFDGWTYVSADLEADPSVDVVIEDPEVLPFDDGAFDVVVSGDTFEHASSFWVLFSEMARVCADDGVIIVLAPSSVGFVHRYPVDCYRFLPDGFQALADRAGVHLVECWRDERGPYHELVGVFTKRPRHSSEPVTEPPAYLPAVDGELQNDAPPDELPEVEIGGGRQSAIHFLASVHAELQPRSYLEVGVAMGYSLLQAQCPSMGIDPAPNITVRLQPHHRVHVGLSQDFFATPELVAELGPLDLAYVDGMHLIENALLDFMHIERHAHPAAVILVDDIFPNHPKQALRTRSSRHWTGDVWKIRDVFRIVRRDLIVLPIDTAPTGTLLVAGLDPTSRALWDGFDHIVAEQAARDEDPPSRVLERRGALDPSDPLIGRVLRMLRDIRETDDIRGGLNRVRQLLAGAMPRRVAGAR